MLSIRNGIRLGGPGKDLRIRDFAVNFTQDCYSSAFRIDTGPTATGGARWYRNDVAHDVRLSRLSPLVGQVAEGQCDDAAAHRQGSFGAHAISDQREMSPHAVLAVDRSIVDSAGCSLRAAA
jgi:hypothetical protein